MISGKTIEKMKWTLLVSCAISFFIAFVYIAFLYVETEWGPSIHINDIKYTSGDLILFRWNPVGPIFRFFTKYNHGGLVVGDRILECHPEGDAEDIGVFSGGVHLNPLMERLKTYNGRCFISRQQIDISDHIDKVDLSEFLDRPFDDNFRATFVKSVVYKLFSVADTSTKPDMCCSELVEAVLQKINVSMDPSTVTTPSSFLKDSTRFCNIPLFGPVSKIII